MMLCFNLAKFNLSLVGKFYSTVCFAHVTVIPTLCPAKDAGRAQPPENTEKTKADPPGILKVLPVSVS